MDRKTIRRLFEGKTITEQGVQSIDTWLPVFSGFYGTYWEPYERINWDSEMEYQQEQYPGLNLETSEDFEFDDEKYEEAVGQAVTDYIGGELKREVPSIKEIDFQRVTSPRQYNFSNDAVFINVKIDVKEFSKWFNNYLEDHTEQFTTYLVDHYKSRSGFISHYPHTVEEWKEETKNWTILENHYLGALMQFICEQENITEDDLYGNIEIYPESYVRLSDDKQEEWKRIKTEKPPQESPLQTKTDFEEEPPSGEVEA